MTKHFLFADVLGFSNLVLNSSHSDLESRFETWIPLVNEMTKETNIEEFQVISDSIFVLEDGSTEGLKRLLSFARLLLEKGLQNYFPIRGAIARGRVTWGTTVYGQPVVDAFQLEKSLDWIGISCVPGLEIEYSWDLVCCYPVPKKSGLVRLAPTVVWSVPEESELINRCTGKGLMKKGDHFRWELHYKFLNTLRFSRYVRRSKQEGLDPATYVGVALDP